ncbi:unnamed protein product [Prorocentrum cordatum]|uniref:Uncharacterized protein n=1 Tax=Prorocentrum cordatum TaxID=2364126 RepID=A0ABN9TEP0_9DINO|nr:unnamed protein product [Polarella glacialis]
MPVEFARASGAILLMASRPVRRTVPEGPPFSQPVNSRASQGAAGGLRCSPGNSGALEEQRRAEVARRCCGVGKTSGTREKPARAGKHAIPILPTPSGPLAGLVHHHSVIAATPGAPLQEEPTSSLVGTDAPAATRTFQPVL